MTKSSDKKTFPTVREFEVETAVEPSSKKWVSLNLIVNPFLLLATLVKVLLAPAIVLPSSVHLKELGPLSDHLAGVALNENPFVE